MLKVCFAFCPYLLNPLLFNIMPHVSLLYENAYVKRIIKFSCRCLTFTPDHNKSRFMSAGTKITTNTITVTTTTITITVTVTTTKVENVF